MKESFPSKAEKLWVEASRGVSEVPVQPVEEWKGQWQQRNSERKIDSRQDMENSGPLF